LESFPRAYSILTPRATTVKARLETLAGRVYAPGARSCATGGKRIMKRADAIFALTGMALYILVLTWR